MAKKQDNLNKEQKEAVLSGEGPLLIVAGAGTGKTTVITERIIFLIERGLAKPEEILAVTFTEKAAAEMEDRVDRLLPFGYHELWISTFHAFCEKVLRDNGLDIGLPGNFKLVDQTAAWLLVRQNLDKFSLDYYRPLGNPMKFIHALLSHFSRCKDQMIYPEDYLKYADELKSNLTDLPEGAEVERIKEVASAYHTYQKVLLDNNLLDFGDLINYCLQLFQKRPAILAKYRDRFKYILVDEFQDTNWAQYELIKTLAAPRNNLAVCADDDQCLPGNAFVAVRDGEKEIRAIKKGDEVLTAVGKGHIGIAKINKIFKQKKKANILTVKTRSGFQIQVTDNHKMFCFVPQVHKNHQYCYVYLMHRQGLGWRMGTTNDLIIRTKLERSVDKILAIKAFKTEVEARYYETLWSLKYGVPTSCFQARENIVIQGDLLLKLYQDLAVENNVRRMAKDLNIDLDSHHFCLEAVTRGSKIRIKINLRICQRSYRSKEHVKRKKELLLNPLIKHCLTVETSDSSTISKMTKAGLHLRKAKKGMALRIEHQDLQELGRIAQHLQKLTGGIIETKFNLALKNPLAGDKNRWRSFPALLIPAKNLVLGHYLPVKTGREIIYDEIISISERERVETVYDLEIDRTHNFFANGVVVHNSIYKWRGASVSNITQFKQDFPSAREVFLVKNYRSSQNILDLAYNFIQANNPNRLEFISGINKKLKAQNEGEGVVEHLHFKNLGQEAAGVAQKIAEILRQDKEATFNDFVILVRANDTANPFARALERAGLPYQFLASQGLYFKPIILDMIAYLKLLDNYHESSAVFRVLSWPVWDIAPEELMQLTHFSHQKTQSLFETISGFALVKGISPKTANSLNKFLAQVRKHTEMAREKNVTEIFLAFLEDSGYLKHITKQETLQQDQSKLEDLEFLTQFYKKLKEFEQANPDGSLKNFMNQFNLELESDEQGKLAFDPDQGPDLVRLMTIHSAKGLEFKYVFAVSMVDRRFPSTERKDPIEISEALVKEKLPEGDVHLQEERRLCYVAMTRAKKGIFFTSADDYGGARKKKISQFLAEMGFTPAPITGKAVADLEPPKKIVKKPSLKIILPEHFSFTQLAAFDTCPYQYKLAHILKVPVRGRPSFSFGKSIHNTLHEFLTRVEESKAKTQENLFGASPTASSPVAPAVSEAELLKIYDEQWLDEWFDSKKQKQDYYQEGKRILKDFYQQFLKGRPKIFQYQGKPALEVEFKLKLGDYTIKGKIDRIDEVEGGVRLMDYKTGASEGKEKISKSDKTQLLLYQIAAEESLGLNPVELCYYYLDGGGLVSFLGSEKEKDDLKTKIIADIEEIKHSDFAPNPGWHCQFCDFRSICEFANKNNN